MNHLFFFLSENEMTGGSFENSVLNQGKNNMTAQVR